MDNISQSQSRILQKRVILHFDINKTIIISDQASGVSTYDMINSLLTECVWGYIIDPSKSRESRGTSDWQMLDPIPSPKPPILEDIRKFLTLGDYLENHTNISKQERRKIKTTFASKGSIGESCKEYFDALNQALKIPLTTGDTTGLLDPFISNGYYHIIPSFFKFVSTMHQEDMNFRICFRTFGHDVSKIAHEYNMFCENKHPLFPLEKSMDGKDKHCGKNIDRRLHLPQYSAKLLRCGHTSSDIHMAYVDSDQTVQIESGAHMVMQRIMNWFSEDNGVGAGVYTVAIRDDYDWWGNQCHGSDLSGKLLLVHPNPTADDDSTIQIFFDDNIELDRAHIVDVRDAETFQPIPFADSKDKYLVRVDPYAAITDTDYFINIVQDIIRKYYTD